MASSAAAMDPAQAAQLAALQRQLRDQIHTWLGTSEFGVIVASVFYGINIIQLYTYASTRERRDPLWIRSLIAWVWCLDTAHTGLIWTWLFDKTVLDAADPTKIVNLFDMTDALILSVVFSGFIGASVQSFYAYRINRLAGHPWFSIPAYIGSAVRAALSVAIAVFGKQAKTLIVFTVMYPWAIHGVLGASVAVDLFNTILTCILLARQRDGLKQTAGMISKMTVWTIENGLLTTATALAMLGLSVSGQFSSVPALLHVYAKLFSFSLLVTLNSREKLRQAIYTMQQSGMPSTGRTGVSNLSRPHYGGYSQHKEPQFELIGTNNFRPQKGTGAAAGHHDRDVEAGVIHIDTEVKMYYDPDVTLSDSPSKDSQFSKQSHSHSHSQSPLSVSQKAAATASPVTRKPVPISFPPLPAGPGTGSRPPKPGMI